MTFNQQSRSASQTSNTSNTSGRSSAAIPAMANPRSRRTSSASRTQVRPSLARASSSTASLTDYSSLKASCFGGFDSYIGIRQVNVYCQMLPGTGIEEEQHRHAHKAMHSYRCTVPFGLLVLDNEQNFPYEIGGLAQKALLDEALCALVCRNNLLGCTLSVTATIDSSGTGSKKSYDINSIVRSAAEPFPMDMSRYYGYGREPLPLGPKLIARFERLEIVIRLKQLEGIEMDVSPKAASVVKDNAYLCKVQYRLTATRKTLGDLVIPSNSHEAILVRALAALAYNEETKETGALFRGPAQVMDNRVLVGVDWNSGRWQLVTRERSGF